MQNWQQRNNVMSEVRNAMLSHNNPVSYNRNINEMDIGYDTDSIAIFEIDKSFTDFLLCQICFSKYKQQQLIHKFRID